LFGGRDILRLRHGPHEPIDELQRFQLQRLGLGARQRLALAAPLVSRVRAARNSGARNPLFMLNDC